MFITVAVLIVINIGLARLLDTQFIDLSFVLGLAAAFLIKFFNSSGGFSSRSLDLSVQSQTGVKQTSVERKFTPSVGFYTSIAYAIFGLIAIFVIYRDYFV
jgi:hypothetical protein